MKEMNETFNERYTCNHKSYQWRLQLSVFLGCAYTDGSQQQLTSVEIIFFCLSLQKEQNWNRQMHL